MDRSFKLPVPHCGSLATSVLEKIYSRFNQLSVMEEKRMNKTIVFIHGAWLNSLSWENFIEYFEKKGYTCSAPEWPLKDKPIDELRANPPEELAQIGVQELTDHYESIIRPLPESPILIGHSFGGLIVQQLLDRGMGSAGVALDAVAPEGVLAVDWTVLKANSNVLFRWMNWEKVLHMTFPEFQFAFVNTFPEDEQKKCYERYVVPESGRLFFQAAFAQLDPHHALRVNFKNNERAPLLLTAGEFDHLVPEHVVKSNYDHHKQSISRTDLFEYKGRSHLLGSQAGWEEIAGDIASWLDQYALASGSIAPASAQENPKG
jgi:pimeloyl-ACP methyl ester carboxylesterase